MKSNPLAAVVPQSHRGPVFSNDGQKGGTCAYLGDKGLLYANQYGLVRENAEQFLERIKREKIGNILWKITRTPWEPWAPLGRSNLHDCT